jgi:hypothetical protein
MPGRAQLAQSEVANTEPSRTIWPPLIGTPIYAKDGEHLGDIVRIDRETGWAKLDAPNRIDYWINLDWVRRSTQSYVLLRLAASEISGQRRESGPPGA